MKSATIAFLFLGVTACGGGGGAPVARDYQIRERADKVEPTVPVRMNVPKGWSEELDAMGGPTFQLAKDSMFPHVAVLVVNCPDGTDGAACIDKRIAIEFGDRKTLRTQRGAAVWTLDRNEKNGGTFEMRYALDDKTHTIVKCVVVASAGEDLAPLHAACDSIVIRP